MIIPIQIPRNGKSIAGILHLPSIRLRGSPTVILCVGINGNRVENERLLVRTGKAFAEQGITFVRFDYLGLGLSDGEFFETSIQQKIYDTFSVINFIKGCFGGDFKLILIGFSDGAKIANHIATSHKEVEALITWSPVLESMNSDITTSYKFTREPNTQEIVFPTLGLWMGKQYLRELKNDRSLEQFIQYDGKKLCVFGSEDKMTSELKTRLMKNRSDKTQIITIDGAGHVYEDRFMAESLIHKTISWIKSEIVE